ncbi:MAG TPA: ABC transporter transmembrane domain-containing protein, partial [Verrucomicrobiae bacterium]|nr:ABC transporter transmembrane domain-containing protein [Verrucomicrobiae bacterium]
MRYALKILSFGWKYIKRYRARLALGLFCSLLYALLNGGTVWALRTLTTNYTSQKVASSVKVAGEHFTFNANLISDAHTNGIPLLLIGTSDSGTFTNEIDLQLILSGRQTNVVINYEAAGTNGPYAARIIASNLVAPTGASAVLNSRFRQLQHNIQAGIDPWIPHFGQPITWQHVLLLLFFVPAFVALRGLVDYGGNYCLGWVGEYAVRDMRLDVMEKLSSLSLDFFTRSSTGDMLTRILADTQNLLRSLRTSAPDLIKESATAIFVFGYLVFIDWRLTLLVLALIPVCAFPIVVLGRKARKATRESRATTVLQTSQLVELISGIRVIKAFGLESSEMERFRKTSKQIVRADMKSVQAKESLGPIIEVLA